MPQEFRDAHASFAAVAKEMKKFILKKSAKNELRPVMVQLMILWPIVHELLATNPSSGNPENARSMRSRAPPPEPVQLRSDFSDRYPQWPPPPSSTGPPSGVAVGDRAKALSEPPPSPSSVGSVSPSHAATEPAGGNQKIKKKNSFRFWSFTRKKGSSVKGSGSTKEKNTFQSDRHLIPTALPPSQTVSYAQSAMTEPAPPQTLAPGQPAQ